MLRRRTVALGAVAGLCAGMLAGGGPSPAAAAVPTDFQLLAGDFVGDARDELFFYTPGAGPDTLSQFSSDAIGMLHEALGEFTVNGTYRPLVGDFDGDDHDEILWYAPGSATDYVWNFTSNSTVSSVPYTVNGNYSRPTVGDYTGDGVDDVLWYAPGTAADYLWDYNAGGGFTSVRRTINGNFIPVSGSFGNDATDDVFWYSPGTAPDYLWNFTPGTAGYTFQQFAVSDTRYRPVSLDMLGEGPGNEDIFWYAPGPGPDYTWDFYLGDVYGFSESVSGEFVTATGDFLGDGQEDVVFENHSGMVMWDHIPGPARQTWVWNYTAAMSAESDARVAPDTTRTAPGTKLGEQPLAAKP